MNPGKLAGKQASVNLSEWACCCVHFCSGTTICTPQIIRAVWIAQTSIKCAGRLVLVWVGWRNALFVGHQSGANLLGQKMSSVKGRILVYRRRLATMLYHIGYYWIVV